MGWLQLVLLGAALSGCRERVLPCRSEYDCLDREVCVAGACHSTCNVSTDCKSGESCLSGACQARTDAAAADAGTSDRRGLDQPGSDHASSDRTGSDRSGTDRAGGDAWIDAGHDSGRDSGVDAGTPYEQFWSAYCQLLVRCSPQWGAVVPDVASCLAVYRQRTSCGGSGTLADPSAVPACVAWIGQMACDQLAIWSNADCLRMFGATTTRAGLGQLCEDVSCADGLYCHWATDNVCPVCRTLPARYQSCGIIDNVYVPCGPEDYCTSFDAGTCNGRLSNGMACENDTQCESWFCRLGLCAAEVQRNQQCTADDRCHASLTCRGGICTDPGSSGIACSSYDGCQMAHACHRGVCAPLDPCTPAQVGAVCNYTPGCTDGAWCNYDEAVNDCVANTPLNGLCTDHRECGENADCIDVSGTRQCIARAGLGGSCAIAYCVDDTYCDYNASPQVCKAFKPNGVDCSSNWECQSYYCNTANHICADEPACTMP